MIRHLVLLLLSCGSVSQTASADVAQVLAAVETQTAWRSLNGNKAEILDNKDLSSYRPHDSRIILEYGFAKLTKLQLVHSSQKPLTLAIYEMLDSAAAYGLFTYLRAPNAEAVNGIGSACAGTAQEINFHQSKYYVVLNSEGSGNALRSIKLQIARAISKLLPNDFSPPMVASKLPNENRIPQSEKFLMGPEALSQVLPLGEKDPFGLATGAEAALARYEHSREIATLLLIHYPTQQLARRMLEAGYKQYSAHYPGQTAFYKRDGPMVVLVLASNSPELATTLLERVSYVSMVSWDPKVEPPNIGQVMINIFIFCGIMLGITLVAGFTLGITRVVIKRFFPGKVFDRTQSMEVIRLHLEEKPQKPR